MKALVVVVIFSCLVAGAARAEESTEWQVEWTTEPAYNLSLVEPFTVPGYLLPDLNISDIISTVGMMYQAEDLVHAIGSLCVEIGPKLSWLSDGAMQELCDPVLEALRNGSYAEAYSICQNSWSFLETLIGGEEGGLEGEGEIDHGPIRRKRWGLSVPSIELPPLPSSPIQAVLNITVPFSPLEDLDFNWTNPLFDDTANMVENIGLIPDLNRNWSFPIFDGTGIEVDFPYPEFSDKYGICSSLAGLISYNQPSSPSHGSIFGVVLNVIVAEQVRSIPGKCLSFFDGEEGSGDIDDDPSFKHEPGAMIWAFATLGGFDDIEQICNVSSWALLMRDEGKFELFNELVNQITTSIYSVISSRSRCIEFADSLHANIGLAPGNYSHFTSSEALCDEILDSLYWRGNMSEIDFYNYDSMDEKDAFIYLLSIVEILSHKSDMASLEFLCRMSPYADEMFCTSLAYNDYRDVSREDIIEHCLRYVAFDGFEFDFLALLNAIGAEFEFDFYDFDQTCSHLTDIVFNSVIRQQFTIDNMIQKGMKAIGRVLSPIFCDLHSFRNGSLDSLEAPCGTPGRGCFNWTRPGEDYFFDRLDEGFIVGTIFSYLGGYRDGDHICHQMAFALDDETVLDMVAGKLRDSVYRLFDDVPFCSDTIGLIEKLIGVDEHAAQMIGFNSTDAFCGEISKIYHQGGNYNFSFVPLLDLFTNHSHGLEHFVTSESIMHVTTEMMKFAAMIMHSDNIGDAISKSCYMWQDSGPGITMPLFEVDDLCQVVLALNPAELQDVCIHDIIPWIEDLFDHHHDDEERGEENEIDFDFTGILETVGEEFGFDFHDSHQSCSHLTGILFDDTVSQNFPIDSVVVRGIRAVGKIVSPIFCDFESFYDLPASHLEAPCATPGQNCFDWSSRGEDFFYEREDIGFVIGTIFSYIGGYRDGDHLCHQMAFALEDDAQLDMVANKMKDSIFRFFNDPSFCPVTMDLINRLIGFDEDAASLLGFENADAFCGKVNQIYNEDGDYNVSLEPLYVLFANVEEEGEFDPAAIINATTEMIKFAAMIMRSDHIGDAISKTCYVWQESAAMLNISEVDDLCKTVLAFNSAELQDVCIHELFPWIEDVFDHHEDDEMREEENEIDFDFTGILETVGEEFGFDFHDSHQSCSHLTGILFDDTVSQNFPIDSVVVRGIRAVGKIVSPIFCDFESFHDHPDTVLEAPCATPGQNCFDWSSRGEDFFYEREDIGFVIGTIFSYIGGYRDGDHLCHQMAFALDDDEQLDMVANKMKDSIFRFFNDPSFCPATMDIINKLIGFDEDAASLLGFENADAFCGKVNQIYNEDGDYNVSLEPLYVLFADVEEEGNFDPAAIMNATTEMIKFAAMIMRSDHIGDAISKTCYVWQESAAMLNISEVDDLCQTVLAFNSAELQDVCIHELFPWIEDVFDHHDDDEMREEENEIDFDFTGILETVGEEFGFDLHDSHQSCSHLTGILFDDTVSQNFPIDSVVVRGIRAVGKIVSPIFCDFESFHDHPDTVLEAPCATPGQNCFDWSSRGEDFFYEREDIGFVIGTIFSYIGGYRDGDHLCHQMAFALEDDAQLDMVANKMKDSIFRFFNDPSFCPVTMDIINRLIGFDEDAASLLGFENADAFCGKVNQIYNEDGDYNVSFEPLYVLFANVEEEGEFDPAAIINATTEMIKFAAMIMRSDHIGDAISKTCYVWQESAAMLNISEIDDLCQLVLEDNSDAVYQVCMGELFPLIESILEDEMYDFNDNHTNTVVDLSNIEICLDNGEVTFEALENLDILAYLLQTTHKLYNLTVFDESNICRAVTSVVESRNDIPTLISEFAVEMMSLFMPLGAEICSCWDQVFDDLFSDSDDSEFGVNQFNEIVRIAVNSIGLDSRHELCDHLIHLKPDNMSDYAQTVIEEILGFTADPEKCACTANRVIDFILPLVNVSMEEINNYLYQYLGYHSVDHVCSFVAQSFSGVIVDPSSINCNSQQEPTTKATTTTQSSLDNNGNSTQSSIDNTGNSTQSPIDNTGDSNETSTDDETCLFITDCAGVCNGNASLDCARECGGSAALDCAFKCGGSATTNECGWCVGGATERPSTLGFDQCGSCIGEGTAVIDCNGDCDGTAYRDACQVCVGGNTSVAEDVSDRFLDCLGICNGSFVTNDCDECVLPFSDGTIFSTADCNGDCNGFADINECSYCVGGNTGNSVDTGLSACGVCNTTIEPDFCLGCDGVADSGLVTDACDVCDGDGSTCFTVDNIAPSIIPANTDYQVKLRGAGFQDATTKQCKFLDSSGEQVSVVDISDEVDDEFNCTANLPQGTYSVYLSTESTELSEAFVTLYVYSEVIINSLSQSEFDIDDSVISISVNMVSTSGAFTAYKDLTTPKAIVFTETERLYYEGTFGGDNDELLEFTGPMLTTSAQVVVYPSFNGIDYLVTPDDAGFTITYYAPAPVAQSLKFSPTGHLLELEFDVAINEDSVTSCDAVFMNITSLGGAAAQCFAFPYLKTIYILPFSSASVNLIGPDDELVLRADVLKKRDEEYARYASGTLTASSPDEAVTVYAALTGTEAISSCGNVRLSALQSFGNAGRFFTYQWSVTSGGSIPSGLTDDLTAAAESAYVTLDGSYLDADVPYTFSMTAENFLGGSDTKTLEVTRSALNKPDVVIYPERVDPNSALISQAFYLRAAVRFYEACGGAEQMEYAWSVDDDSIALNLQTINKPLLYVAAGSLPGDSQVTFTLEVNRESDPSTVTTQTVTITTVYTDLDALIDGGSERTIGVDSESFTLDGSSSFDPDSENEEMTYLWTCQKSNTETGSYEPCVSSETREVFPAEADSKTSTLTLASNNLYSDSTYLFTLEINKLSRTASTSVTILSKSGNPPTISLDESLPEKIKSSSSHTLRVLISHTSDITIDWATVDIDLGYGYVDFSQLNSQSFLIQGDTSPFITYAFVTIPTGTLEEDVAYSFSVTVTDTEGQVSASKLTTNTYGGVSSCTFSLGDGSTSYQELDEITLLTQNCVTDEEAYPLSYQVFREKVESSVTRYNAMTGALAEASSTILGLPSFSDNQNTFVVKVCNDFGSCSSYSLTLDVTPIASFSQEQFDESITNLVEPQKLSGNFLDALVNFNTITSVGVDSTSRKRRAVSETSSTATEQLDLLQNAISSTVLDTATAQTLLDQSDGVVIADLTLSDMDIYLDILIELVAVFSDEGLPESSAEIVLTKTSEIAAELDPQYNSDMLAKITTLRNTLIQGQLSQIPLGGDPTETRSGSVTTRAFYAIPSDTLSTASSNTSFNVKFGSEIESLYGASWSCASGSTCSGVQIMFTQYDDEVDYYSTTDEDKANRASSILEIDLLDPSDNSELSITGLSSPISINMTASRLQSDKVYDCYWWDTSSSSWSQDGLTTVYHSSVLSECQTTHLSAFTLIAVDSPTTIMMATTIVDDASTSTDAVASTATTEISESGSSGLSSTVIIVIAVVISVVLILIIIIAIVVVMSKKSSKVGNADIENSNGNGARNGTSTADGLAPVESANQAFNAPPTAPAHPTHTVQVVAAPASAPASQEPIMDVADLPGSPSPPPDGPHIDTIIKDVQNDSRAQTPMDRAMTPVE
ncbi:receptor for egg jelly 8 isoform X1 [Strongylocentrotus purpuratus]|uniref:GAIN-B domain-containing protein n=1 Tax=Strongylocentrotus purpuratus TaxID=7668 RepID=A0A7M7N709_STRPU|nr:receptor for egg jelly 8 isoform X1 [Strongylocentrotus purpuratus]XP_030832122.1 receptor for egg jelly 8 isoform X1 [Strongylocentrotus purpuratus]